jgi:hypothetical protein
VTGSNYPNLLMQAVPHVHVFPRRQRFDSTVFCKVCGIDKKETETK